METVKDLETLLNLVERREEFEVKKVIINNVMQLGIRRANTSEKYRPVHLEDAWQLLSEGKEKAAKDRTNSFLNSIPVYMNEEK